MADTISYPSTLEVRFSRPLAATPTLVWRAHTEQGQLERWWGPEGFVISATHEMDVRTGGRWQFVMRGPGPGGAQTDYPNRIQYEEVVPEQRLSWAHGDFERVHFHVCTQFIPDGAGTRLDTTMRFATQAERDATLLYSIPGHESAMQRLETYLQNPWHELSFTRMLDAPVAGIWAAWTVREQLMPWFCPRPWRVTECEIDLRPGGIFRTLMQGPDGESFDHIACYLCVEHEKRLIWSDALQPGYAPAVKPWCTCVVELHPVSATQTRLTARVQHADSATCEDHARMGFPEGWHIALDQMLEQLGQSKAK